MYTDFDEYIHGDWQGYLLSSSYFSIHPKDFQQNIQSSV